MNRLGMLLAGLMIAAPSVLTSGGFQLNEHGARAVGQGGAWAARAYDPSAIFFNPAGLGFQRGVQVSLGSIMIAPVITYYGVGTGSVPMTEQTFFPINGYVTASITDDLTAGVGVYNAYGLGTEWPGSWIGRYITTKADLISFFVSPTVAYRLSDDLSIGVGVNIVTGSASLARIVSDPFAQTEHTALIEADGTAYSFNAGVLYRATDRLSFGASYRSATTVTATGKASFTPARSYLPAGDVETSLTLPATGYIGVAYKVTDDLEVEADYQYVGWSSYDELAVSFKADGSRQADPKKYQDTYILRFGAEYTMGRLQVRGGYFFDNNPVPDTYVEPTLPDLDRHGLNVGIGYRLTEKLTVDVSYMYLKGVQRTVSGTYAGFDGTYGTTATLIGAGVSITL